MKNKDVINWKNKFNMSYFYYKQVIRYWIYTINIVINHGIIYLKDITDIAERQIKGPGYRLFGYLEKPLYEVCFIRIKEQVGEKRSTFDTHGNADYLLKNTLNSAILNFNVKKGMFINKIYF